FFLGAQASGFQAQVGRPYAISICRYLGNGTEESDDDGNGFNIELDNFGLVLWAFAEYVDASGDQAFLAANWPKVRDQIAGALALPDGSIASSVEELAIGAGSAADGSVAEAINFGLVAGNSTQAQATLAYLDRSLRAWPLRSPGYLRNDDAKSYGPNNWYDR